MFSIPHSTLRPPLRGGLFVGVLTGVLVGLLLAPTALPGQAPPVLHLSGEASCFPHQAELVTLPDGGFTVAWVDEGSLWARRFNAHGAALSQEFRVLEDLTAGTEVAVVAATSGNVAFRAVVDREQVVTVRRPDGVPLPDGLSELLALSDFFGAPEASIVADHQGGFLLFGSTPANDGLRLVTLDAVGRPVGTSRDLAPPEGAKFETFQGFADHAVVTSDGDLWLASLLNFVTSPPSAAALVDRVPAGSSVQERILERSGSVFLPGNLVTRGNEVDLVYLQNDLGGSLVVDRFNTDGAFLGRTEDLQLETNLPLNGFLAVELVTATSDAGGNLLVTWLRTSSENGPSIRALTVSPEGKIVAPPTTLFEGTGERLLAPSAATLEAGRALVVWSPLLHRDQFPVDCTDDPGPFASLPLLRATEPDGSRDLLLQGGRFRVSVEWETLVLDMADQGPGRALPETDDTGSFWFFDPDNIELTVKVLDGRTVNGNFWVFYGALSDVAYTITVVDQVVGTTRVFENPAGRLASFADISAFPDP